tara:strand:- start:957 stop:1418 length:462 start_codon:yes stop_codon:yes gene_type:complete
LEKKKKRKITMAMLYTTSTSSLRIELYESASSSRAASPPSEEVESTAQHPPPPLSPSSLGRVRSSSLQMGSPLLLRTAVAALPPAERKAQRRLAKKRAKLMRKLLAIEQEMSVVEMHIQAATASEASERNSPAPTPPAALTTRKRRTIALVSS